MPPTDLERYVSGSLGKMQVVAAKTLPQQPGLGNDAAWLWEQSGFPVVGAQRVQARGPCCCRG